MDAKKAFIEDFETLWPLWGDYVKDKVSQIESGETDKIKSPRYFTLRRTENTITAEIYSNNTIKRYCWSMED